MTDEEWDTHLESIVDQAPPLSELQRVRLRRILAGAVAAWAAEQEEGPVAATSP